MALDTLINQWADEGNDQFLYGSPNGVVLTLQRSALQEGTWTKHHREFDFNTHVNIPFSEDGHNVHYASTSISGALKLEASWEDPWKPHCALDLLLNCAQAALPALQLQRFPPISRNYYPKHLWISFSENDGPFEMLGQSITGLGSDFARWATQTTSPRTCTNQSLAEALALLSIRHLWPTQPNREFGRKAVQLSGRKWASVSTWQPMEGTRASFRISRTWYIEYHNMPPKKWTNHTLLNIYFNGSSVDTCPLLSSRRSFSMSRT